MENIFIRPAATQESTVQPISHVTQTRFNVYSCLFEHGLQINNIAFKRQQFINKKYLSSHYYITYA